MRIGWSKKVVHDEKKDLAHHGIRSGGQSGRKQRRERMFSPSLSFTSLFTVHSFLCASPVLLSQGNCILSSYHITFTWDGEPSSR